MTALALAPLPTPRRSSAKPFTVPHFRRWAADLILDTGESWHPEGFQEAFLADVFLGLPECWLVVPEGNGKTTLIAGLALYHAEYRQFASVPVAAASREQAEHVYRQAEGFVLRSPRMYESVHSPIQAAKGKKKTTVPRFVCLEGYRRINHHAGGRIQVFAADDRTGDGVIPTLGILDELHRHRDLALYRTWAGKLLKRTGQIVTISTAGEPDSDFELTREAIRQGIGEITRKGSFTRHRSKRVILHEWALPETSDPEDMAAVAATNPFSGITRARLTEKFASPTMTMHHWLRFVCNRPSHDVVSWLGEDGPRLWGDLADVVALEKGAPTWAGVDVGIKRDSTAVVAVQRQAGKLVAVPHFWLPTEGRAVDVTDVMAYLRTLDREYDLRAVSFDPRFFDVPAKMLEDDGLPMVEVPQSVERMTPVIGTLFETIKRSELVHDGDTILTSHILNAVPRYNDRGFTLQKAKSKGRIDGAIALGLAIDRANHAEAPGEFVSGWA